MRFKLRIFDWNATLLDDLKLNYFCLERIFETFAPNVTPPTREAHRHEMNHSNILEFFYRNGIPRSVTRQDMGKVRHEHYDQNIVQAKLYGGAEDLLRFCKKAEGSNAIVSGSTDDVPHHLNVLGVSDFFAKTLFSVTEKSKAIARLLEEFGVAPQDAFYLDDTYMGISEAKEVGLTTIGITHGCDSREKLEAADPTRIVDSLGELLTLLKNNDI